MNINQATITFDHQPQIKVAGQLKSFTFEAPDANGNSVSKDVKLLDNTYAKLTKRQDGKYDVTIHAHEGENLSKCSLKVTGGSVSSLKSSLGAEISNQNSRQMNGEKLSFTSDFEKGYRASSQPLFDHKMVGKTKINESITADIAKPHAAQKWVKSEDETWTKLPSENVGERNEVSNPSQRSQIGGDVASLKEELDQLIQSRDNLEQVQPQGIESKEKHALEKQTYDNDIRSIKERIASRETQTGPSQRGHELLRKRAIDPLTTENLGGARLATLRKTFQKLNQLLGPELAGKLEEFPKMEKRLQTLKNNLANTNLTKMFSSEDKAEHDRQLEEEIQGLTQEIEVLRQPYELKNELDELEAQIDSSGHQTTWERVKDSHINQVGSVSKLNMVMALDSRNSAFVESARKVAEEMNVVICFPGDKPPTGPDAGYFKVGINGSTELSSDIDVNITAVGLPASVETKFVSLFNQESQKNYGDQMGNNFDINLYNSMNGKFPNVDEEIQKAGTGLTPVRSSNIEEPAAQKLDDRNEAVISYLHMARFMKPEQFAKYQEAHGQGLSASGVDGTTTTDLTKRLEEGATIAQDNANAVSEKVQGFKKTGNVGIKTDKELELIASNVLYEERSTSAHETTAAADTDLKKVNADHEMTKAHYFANEAAMTRGVLRATVGKEQIIPGINRKRAEKGMDPVNMLAVSAEEYASAGRENIGNVFKEINHHEKDSAPMQLVRASKYFGRANRNYQDLVKELNVTLDGQAKTAMDFLDKLSNAESYSGVNEKKGLLALRKDLLGGSHELDIRNGETAEQAKSRHATEIMEKSGLGEFVHAPGALHDKMIESYAVLDALLSTKIES
jgi:hypothetical protein